MFKRKCVCVCSAVTKTKLDLRDIADEIKRNSSIFQCFHGTEQKIKIGFDFGGKTCGTGVVFKLLLTF